MEDSLHQAVERTARDAYGRILAVLASRGGDLAGAEDALGEAFLSALTVWPKTGVPTNPPGWILTVARNHQTDAMRRLSTRERAAHALRVLAGPTHDHDAAAFPDDRLKLLFVCTHPAIDEASRTPLMLQTVLGHDAATIARAFLTSPDAMSQRLVRAKTKIRAAKIPFRIPDAPEWPERVGFVLDAIYAAFTAGWELDGNTARCAEDAIWLGRMLVRLTPASPEALGLLALMLHCHARRAARRDARGHFIPLDNQDPTRWDAAMIAEAEGLIRSAAAHHAPGRYQIEAAIQSVHAERLHTGRTRWPVIVALYDALLAETPAIGARIGRALARSHTSSPGEALAEIESLLGSTAENHQPFWAALATLRKAAGVADTTALDRAIAMTHDPAVKAFLSRNSTGLPRANP
jgi:RNA polymerase sigma-70 factor (ECF subfamily)